MRFWEVNLPPVLIKGTYCDDLFRLLLESFKYEEDLGEDFVPFHNKFKVIHSLIFAPVLHSFAGGH